MLLNKPPPENIPALWSTRRRIRLAFLLSSCLLLLCTGCAMINPEPGKSASGAAAAASKVGTDDTHTQATASSETSGPVADNANAEAASHSDNQNADTNKPAAREVRTEQQAAGQRRQQSAAAASSAVAAGLLLDRLLAGFSFPDCSKDPQALIWESWYQNHPDYLQRVFKRAEPWLYLVLAEIERRDLPLEFALLPVIESAYDVFALSPAGAHGAWQMTLPTAQDYGLTVQSGFDGRRDMVLATTAATTMLDRLMTDFDGNWRLALAAYNAGPARVARAARRARRPLRQLDPALLALPRETKTFAPKLHGLVCLLRKHHATLPLPDIADQPVIASVEFDRPVDLVEVAHRAEIDIAALYALNAGLSGHLTPATGYALKLPLRHLPALRATLDSDNEGSSHGPAVLQSEPTEVHAQVTVRRGDTLGAIARHHQTTVRELQQLNQLSGHLIRPGQVLLLAGSPDPTTVSNKVPGYAAQLAQLQQLQKSLPGVNSLRHRIGRNETLSTIARRYRVSVTQLQHWNNISNPHRIRVGQTLRIYHAQPVAAGNNTAYRVQRGDSLWTIARRFRISLNDLMIWNQLSGNSVLRPGQLLQLSP